MGLDHSNAFVRLSFDGLIGFCFRRRDDHRCEMGIVQVKDHDPLINVDRINPNGTWKSMLTNFALTPKHNVLIEVKDPVQTKSTTFPSPAAAYEFDRLSDTGDAEDFRWIMDLQGEDFHGEHLRLKRGGAEDTVLRPRISIPSAIFYTLDKTQHQFRRYTDPEDPAPRPIGKIADRVGADILCRPGEKGQKLVTLKIAGQKDLELFRNTKEGSAFRYWIRITNLCRYTDDGKPVCPDQSDFPHYYRVAEDADGIKYDLGAIHPPDDNLGRNLVTQFNEKHYPEFAGFRSNGPPQVCAVGFFGLANVIP
jgi:hypothetical protein